MIMQWWKTLILFFSFDGVNAARLPTSATKKHKLIGFTIEQTSSQR